MSRKPLIMRNFNKGIVLKSDLVTEPGIYQLSGLKFKKLGALGYRGGLDEYEIINPTDFSRIQGLKKWYRKDGGYNLFLIGDRLTGSTGLFEIPLPSGNLNFLQSILPSEYDVEAPALWENCDSQMILLLDGMNVKPYSIKLSGSGINVGPLGLQKPTEIFTVGYQTFSSITSYLGNEAIDGAFKFYKYQYFLTYTYGTPEAPGLYGESDHGPIVTILIPQGSIGISAVFNNLTNISSAVPTNVTKINVYRTLKDGISFYKVNSFRPGITSWSDYIADSKVDLSKTPPTLVGTPKPMRAAKFFNSRLWSYGTSGRAYYSAVGYPDIQPEQYFVDAGNIGFRGEGWGVIRNNLYGFKQDGIFLYEGSAPNFSAKRVDPAKCFSRGSIVEMPEGIYFLGERDGNIGIYKFNGNSAVLLSEGVSELFDDTELLFKKAFARRVGDEYWIAITCSKHGYDIDNPKFVVYPMPFNNLLLCYNPKYPEWSTDHIQAGSIEVFDGIGDEGQVFITESDNLPGIILTGGTITGQNIVYCSNGEAIKALKGALVTGPGIQAGTRVTSVATIDFSSFNISLPATLTLGGSAISIVPDNKGKIFQVVPGSQVIAVSHCKNGYREYDKAFARKPRLSLGPFLSPDNPFYPLNLYKLILNVRGAGYNKVDLNIYDGSLDSIAPTLAVVANDLRESGPLWDTDRFDTAVGAPEILSRQEFVIKDIEGPRTSYLAELVFDLSLVGTDFEIEGLEVLYDNNEPEEE